MLDYIGSSVRRYYTLASVHDVILAFEGEERVAVKGVYTTWKMYHRGRKY